MNILSRDKHSNESNGLRARLVALPAWVQWSAVVVAFLAVVFTGWLGLQGLAAKSNLEQARASALQAKDALLNGKSEDAIRAAENAQFHARQARAATHSLPWNIAGAVPMLGSPLKTTQQISDVVVGLADDVLLPTATMGGSISPDKLIDGTRLNLDLLRAEQPRLTDLAAAAAKLASQAQGISKPGFLSLIGDARSQLQNQTAQLAKLLGNTSIAAQLAPSMLGADGPRTYLMAFQTPAEARGTGGLIGGFGILRFENGIPTVDKLVSNSELGEKCLKGRAEGLETPTDCSGGVIADVDLGPEFNKVYGWTNPLTDFRNSNLSPHFPYAAQIWKSLWERYSGTSVDGVIALDPVTLSYVLGAIGPVTLADGEIITADNVVELTMSTAYVRFSNDNAARKKYLQDIAGAVVEKMTGSIQSPRRLIDALGKAAGERRISVWSASPADQKLLEATPISHVVPNDEAPYAQVIINNLAGNKMDYYLKREIEYAADGCDTEIRNSTITVKLANTASDRPLPDYVAGTPGLAKDIPLEAPSGTMVSAVRVFATKGAKLMSVSSNGKRTSAVSHLENGRPSFEVQIAIPPGQSGELIFRLSEPAAPGEAQVPVQPLIDNVAPKVSVPTCR